MRARPIACALSSALAAGCASTPPAEDPAEGTQAWEWAGRGDPPAPDAEEARASIQALLDMLRTLHAGLAITAYDTSMAWATPTCPEIAVSVTEDSGTLGFWYGICNGDDGVVYKGPMTTWRWDDLDIRGGSVDQLTGVLAADARYEGFLFDGAGILGQPNIYDLAGDRDFSCACTAMEGKGVAADGSEAWFSLMDGPAAWADPAAAGTWLASGVHVELWLWAEVDLAARARTLVFDGNVGGFAERYGTARISGVVGRSLDEAGACRGAGSSLQLDVRDAATADWISLEFAIAPTPSACEACASFGGDAVCVDLAPLVSWEAAPW